ncbi:unnamed protein product, partial [marine sediment metagenome]
GLVIAQGVHNTVIVYPNDSDNTTVTNRTFWITATESDTSQVFRIWELMSVEFMAFDTLGNDSVDADIIFQTSTDTSALYSDMLTVDIWHHIVGTYDLTISDGIKIYVDGALEGTSTNNPQTMRDPEELLYIGTTHTQTAHMNCIMDDFYIRKDVMTLEEIKAIYNSNKAFGYKRNHFSALMLADKSFRPIQHRGGQVYSFELNAKEVLT